MKLLIIVILAVLAYFGYRYFAGDGAKPPTSDVEAKLSGFLAAAKGNCSVSHLSDVSIGDFNQQFAGWPVYASHEEVCRDGDTTTTYAGLDDAKNQVAAAFARRNASGVVELFIPGFFQDAQRQLSQDAQQQLQGALDSAKTN
jgi:hypothetical protein